MLKQSEIYPQIVDFLQGSTVGSKWLELTAEFDQAEIYLAGGSLRDLLLGRKTDPKDLDLFLGGCDTDKILTRLAAEGRLIRGPFGTPRWFLSETENVYCDVIPIATFNNGLWPCEDIHDVLNQFDFTANAVAVDLRNGMFFDPQNGRRDLLAGRMRAVRFDYPDEPISSSVNLTRPAVVWFRILHYAATLGLIIEPVTQSWLVTHNHYADQLEEFSAVFFRVDREALAVLQTNGITSAP